MFRLTWAGARNLFLFCLVFSIFNCAFLYNSYGQEDETFLTLDEGSDEDFLNDNFDEGDAEGEAQVGEESLKPLANEESLEPTAEEGSTETLPDEPSSVELESEEFGGIGEQKPSPIVESELNVVDDPPDLAYEAELHNIYLQYYSKPIPDVEWDYIVGERANERYEIRKGDTLWDLSKTFFGDGNYWPKVWSINKSIPNPHIIEPKNIIGFVLGTVDDAPMFTVTGPPKPGDKNGEPVTTEVDNLDDLEAEFEAEFEVDEEFEDEFLTDEEIDEIVIPPPSIQIMPVTQSYPPSLPKWRSVGEELLDSLTVRLGFDRPKFKSIRLPLTYFIDESAPDSYGAVVAIEDGSRLAADYNYVYVRIRRFIGEIGQKFTVIRGRGPLETDRGVIENALTYEVQGQIVLVEKVQPTKKYASPLFDVFRAKVTSNLTAITPGGELYNEEYIYTTLDKKGRVPKVSGVIIGGEFDTKRRIATTGSLIYINRGADEGLREGDILPIYSNHYTINEDPYVLTTSKPMGLVKLAYVSDLYSSGYVVHNNGRIITGDFVGAQKDFEKIYLSEKDFKRRKKAPVDKELLQLKKELLSTKSKPKSETQEEFEFSEDEATRAKLIDDEDM